MGKLRLIVGSSGTGKTTKLVEQAIQVMEENKPVTLFSLETTALWMELWFISQMTGIQRNRLLKARKQMEYLLETEKQSHNVALTKLKGDCHGRLTIYDTVINFQDMLEVIQKSADRDFYIDYWDLLLNNSKVQSQSTMDCESNIGRHNSMNELLKMTKELDVNITMVTQQTTNVESIFGRKQIELFNIADEVVHMTNKEV